MSMSTQFMDEYELWRGDMAMLCAVEYDWRHYARGYDPEGWPIEDIYLEVLKVDVYAWWEVDAQGQEVAGWDAPEGIRDGGTHMHQIPVPLMPPFTEEERKKFEEHVIEMSCPDE